LVKIKWCTSTNVLKFFWVYSSKKGTKPFYFSPSPSPFHPGRVIYGWTLAPPIGGGELMDGHLIVSIGKCHKVLQFDGGN
jgi:hypothetical protein